MAKLFCVVEGQGDVMALPLLLRRLVPGVETGTPWRVHGTNILRGGMAELAMPIERARRDGAWGVLILLDGDCAEANCPKQVVPRLQPQVQALGGDLPVALVLAECEFETWFLEAAESLRGQRGLPTDLIRPPNPLSIRGAKEWLGRQMPDGYSATQDQPALAAVMDLALARQYSRSFRKLCDEVARLCQSR